MKQANLNVNSMKVNCPICNGSEQESLAEYTSDDSLKHLSISTLSDGYLPLKHQIIANWGSDRCTFVACRDCNFNYADPFIAGTNELYSFFYNAPQQSGTLNWDHILAKSLILKKFGTNNLEDKKLKTESEIKELERDINQLTKEIENSDSLEFVEKVARDELGMVKPREIIYIDKNKVKKGLNNGIENMTESR